MQRRDEVHPSIDSPFLSEVHRIARNVAGAPRVPILILAERGCGAEHVAAYIHELDPRVDRWNATVSCRGVGERQIHRELFGDGESTMIGRPPVFRRAVPGTVFIDEVSLLGPTTQASLSELLAWQRSSSPSDAATPTVRVVAATSVDLEHAARERSFRADLLEQLSVVTLSVPPLRKRPSDIVPLAAKLLEQFARESGTPLRVLSQAAADKLRAHPFRGNIRELTVTVERAAISETNTVISPESILLDSSFAPVTEGSFANMIAQLTEGGSTPPTMEQLESMYLTWLLRRTGGNRTAAAKLMGVSYPTIMKKIRDYQINYRSLADVRSGQGPTGPKGG